MHQLIVVQYVVTLVSSGLNAGYFFRYRSPVRRRRIGAVVLAAVSAAVFLESLYFGLFALFGGRAWALAFFLDPGRWLFATLPLCIGSLAVSMLILHRFFVARQ